MNAADKRLRRRRNRLRGWLWLLVLLFAVCVVLPRWTAGLVRSWFVPTLTARSGPLEHVSERQGLALWRETFVESPAAGILRPLVNDGERVQAGQAVAVIEAPGEWRSGNRNTARTVYAPVAGLVRFDWMGPPRPDPAEALSWADSILQEIGSIHHESRPNQAVRPGDLLFRVVDNHYAYMYIPWENGPPIEEGQHVWLRVAGGGRAARGEFEVRSQPTASRWRRRQAKDDAAGPMEEWAATVIAARPLPTGSPGDAIVVQLHAWPPGWERLNWFDTTVVVRRYHGMVVPETLLKQRGERQGVWIRGHKGALFHPVQVQGRVEGLVAVDGLPPGVALLANPPPDN